MAEKIFVELDEEIIFITEKIQKTEGDQVILIVPDRAALLGSVVSLKLLAQEIAKLKKTAVLVTTDEVGMKLIKKADLVSVATVSEISAQTWKKAKQLQQKLIQQREREKKDLVGERKEQEPTKKDIEEDQGFSSEKGVPSKEGVSEADEEMSSGSKEDRIQASLGSGPQIVNIEGFEMAAGGDIAEMETSPDDGEDKDMVLEEMAAESKSDDDREGREEHQPKRRKDDGDTLVGTDLSTSARFTASRKDRLSGDKKAVNGVGGGISSFFAKTAGNIRNFLTEGGNRPKLLIAAGVILILFFAVSYFILPSGKVIITVESQDIKLDREVIADTEITTLNVSELTIPAETIEQTLERSGETEATGTKETGEKAVGQVTIYNLTESDVSVNAGTVLESIETGLNYITASTVTVPAKRPDDDPEYPGLFGTVDVGVTAEKFGEEYNVQTKQEFRISGFDVDNLYGKNFNNISGGSTEEQLVVSQENFDDLKKEIVDGMKEELRTALEESAGEEKELLVDTIEYEVTSEEPTPQVGEQAQKLNLTVSIKATALAFSKDAITQLSEELVSTENEQNVEIEEFEYSSEVIKTEGSKIYIDLTITGIVTPSIDEDSIKSELQGATRSRAVEYLSGRDEIQDYTIELSPKWLPSFLSHFPSSPDKIEVEIEKQ